MKDKYVLFFEAESEKPHIKKGKVTQLKGSDYKIEYSDGSFICTRFIDENQIFDTQEQAEQQFKDWKALYKVFDHIPYMRLEDVIKCSKAMLYIQNTIKERLKECPNFDSIDFCNVHAGGIQIRGFHKKVKGYSYGSQITLNCDFSNKEERIKAFVDMWKAADNQKEVDRYNGFLRDGEKWGWD